MNKLSLALTLSTFLLVLSASPTHAALVDVDQTGNVTWHVLGAEIALAPQKNQIEVDNVAGENEDSDLLILEKQGDQLYLNNFDVTSYSDDLIQISERGQTRQITIGQKEGQFVITQGDAQVITSFPITIDPKRNEFAVKTDSGAIYLSVLPLEAAQTALRSRFITKVDGNSLTLTEPEPGQLAYEVKGQKVFDIFNLFDYSVDVTTQVSATTGEVLGVHGPDWFKVFGFLFS